MKKLLKIDLGLQLCCVLFTLVFLLLTYNRDSYDWLSLNLTAVQWLSALFWGIRLKRDRKSYGRRVYEKVLLLVLGLVLAGLAVLVLFEHPFLIWVLYFLLFGTVFLNLWYLGITIVELVKAARRGNPDISSAKEY